MDPSASNQETCEGRGSSPALWIKTDNSINIKESHKFPKELAITQVEIYLRRCLEQNNEDLQLF